MAARLLERDATNSLDSPLKLQKQTAMVRRTQPNNNGANLRAVKWRLHLIDSYPTAEGSMQMVVVLEGVFAASSEPFELMN